MSEQPNVDQEIREILWESLDGGDYDLARLQQELGSDTRLDDLLDSLDITDFVLRLEHRFQINIAQEDYIKLGSLAAIQGYVREHSPTVRAGGAPA